MNDMAHNEKEKIEYIGKTFELLKRHIKTGDKIIEFEIARRSPGVRLIITKSRKILLTKEYRYELKGYDYRLPGGKVFDTLKDYILARNKKTGIIKYAIRAAKKECMEETGFIAKSIKHFQTSKAGATVDWDLYYFTVNKFKECAGGQKLGYGEDIKPEWKTFEEVMKLCLNNKIKEARSVGVLLRFLLKNSAHK
ncbi:NUDIX domain-containing protein [Candidatus Woesearchaeota archaeon]|nr:NUDIX domain-containing protein [Candidatus Woesearchaeota archaeon]